MLGRSMNYSKTCFVIMPFGKKDVGNRNVDFDKVYEQVFVPAIDAAPLPEGGKLVAARTDKDFFSGEITSEMFAYLEYSRIAVADISGLNANVFYEMGVRHRARGYGTAIFRQADAPIPFDINHVKAFPYEYEPEQKALESRTLITRVLEESLRMNRTDSPVRLTLDAQQKDPPAVQKALLAGENAIRAKNLSAAIGYLSRAVALVPGNANIRVKLGLLLKENGGWDEALVHFQQATEALPAYADAWRELGIAENKVYWKAGKPAGEPTGEDSLVRAISINPNDFDALASLGGILKREGRLEEARDAYSKSRKVSVANPYPLLNEIKLRAHLAKRLELGPDERAMLVRVQPSLRAQTSNPSGAFNAPWSFFDLSEVRLYSDDVQEFESLLEKGLASCTAAWQPQTHRESLELLLSVDTMLPVLTTALEKCALREQELVASR